MADVYRRKRWTITILGSPYSCVTILVIQSGSREARAVVSYTCRYDDGLPTAPGGGKVRRAKCRLCAGPVAHYASPFFWPTFLKQSYVISIIIIIIIIIITLWPIPTERQPLVGEVSVNFCGLRVSCGQRDDPYGRILGFLNRSRYFFFQIAPQLYSRGWVDPISYPLLLRKSGSAGNRSRTSGSVARNSDHWTTEAVFMVSPCCVYVFPILTFKHPNQSLRNFPRTSRHLSTSQLRTM
jgi:hypothetical protein